MKEFENIQKHLPYTESEDYVNKLIERTTELAIQQKPKARVIPLRTYIASAAAAALLLIGIGTFYMNDHQATADIALAQVDEESPLDEFLGNLSDEEAQLLAYYNIEDIPEY